MADRVRTPRGKVAVGAEAEFTQGAFRIVTVGRHEIGIIRLADGGLHAVRNICPHKAAPICQGLVGGTWPPCAPGELRYERDGEVLVCPWHGWEYDIRSGEELYQEKPTQLRKFPVTVEDGQVFITI